MREAPGAPPEAYASRPSSPREHLPKDFFSCVSNGASRAFGRQKISRWIQGSAPLHCVVLLLICLALIELPTSSLAFAFRANTPQTFSVSSLLKPKQAPSTEAVLQPQGSPSRLFRSSWASSQAHSWVASAGTLTRPLDDSGPSSSNLKRSDLAASPPEAEGAPAAGCTESTNAGRQHSPPLAGGPSSVEVNSFFRFLEALAVSKQQQQQLQQQQQRSVPLSAAVDAVLFLAGCAVSPQWTLRISRAAEPPSGPQAESSLTSQQQPQREFGWQLFCTPSGTAAPPEAVALQAVTSLFISLHQLLPQLPCSSVTRLLPPLFLLGRSLGVAATAPHLDAAKEVREAAAALLQLLQAVLQRAAAEAPKLPAGETVQRVTAVADALAGWSRRDPEGPPSSFIPLLSLGNTENSSSDDRGGGVPWQGRPGREAPADAGANALAAALQREGAPTLPRTLLHAAAGVMEASARAATQGLSEAERLHQHDPQQRDMQSFCLPRKLQQQQHQQQQQQQQQASAAGMLRRPADTVREVVAAIAAWLPVYYLIMRVNGGIWLPALQQLAEAAAHQTTRLLELFLSHQQQQQQQQQEQQQRGSRGLEGAAEEAHCNAWNAVGRLLYGEVQQLTACLARMHALKPLRGMRRLASAAVAFDRHLSAQLSAAGAPNKQTDAPLAVAAAAALNGSSTALPLRPLLHTRDPPKDLREAERRVRFFCSMVALGVGDPSISSGVAACLPSERQLLSLSPLDREVKQQNQRQKARLRSHNAEAAATQCARHLPLQLLQRLLVCCSWIGDSNLVLRGLAALKLRMETLTLQHLMRAHNASPLDSSRGSSRPASTSQTTTAAALAPAAAASPAPAGESNAAELVGKTLALLAKAAFRGSRAPAGGGDMLGSPAGTPFSLGAQQVPNKGLREETPDLKEALCDLASAATLWAAATGFKRQSPEDVALLTFSLIPFWLQQDPAAGVTTSTHTAQHVEHIRAAAAAAAAATAAQQKQQQNQMAHDEAQQGELTEQQLVNLARSLRGVSGFFAGRGAAAASAARAVSPAAVEFFLSELTERRGAELAKWPPPLLFLLAYNVLRLRLTRSPEAGKGLPRSGLADGDASPPAGAAAGAAAARQQQLGKAVETSAAQLLLRVVAAIEEGVTFPEPVNAWCRQVSLQPGKQQQHIKQQPSILNAERASSSLGHKLAETPRSTSAELSAVEGPVSATTASAADDDDQRRCNIRLVGLREVGSFLWALSRAEGGYSAALAAGGGAAEDAEADRPEAGGKAASFSRSLSSLSNDLNGSAAPTLQEASSIAARAVRRTGGLADKLAVYWGAAIREANSRLLERSSPAAFRRPLSGSRPAQQSGSHSSAAAAAAAAVESVSADLSDAKSSPLEALKAFCRKHPSRGRAPVMLRSSDLPSLSWTATAGVSLGLLLNFFSSCRPEVFNHVLSAVLQAPLLAADCGLPQLFHLLRPLAASVRSDLEAPVKTQGETPSAISHAEALPASSSQKRIAQHHETQLAGSQQQSTRGSSSSSNSSNNSSSSSRGGLRLLEEAQAFIFAVAVGLLQHAQAVASLPPDTPRTAAQVQLLFLASSDFALLLHAHCLPADRMQGAHSSPLKSERPQSTCVTASAGFRRVLQELLALLSGLAVRHAKQICGSLSLLAAAAEIFSRCGRCTPLPQGSRQAMQSFAPAAIAALRQPASSHSWRNNSTEASSFHAQKARGAEEVRRLAAALEALKFVELK